MGGNFMFQLHETGELIRALRKQKNLTQEDLAGYANIDVATLSKIENGHAMPKQATFRRLLDVLKFDVGDVAHLFMSKEEAEHEEIRKEGSRQLRIMQLKQMDDVNNLNQYLEKTAQNENYLRVPQNMQNFLNLQANMLTRLAQAERSSYNKLGLTYEEHAELRANFKYSPQVAEGLDRAIELIYQALKVSIPNFEIEKISEYYLTTRERALLGSLSNAYNAKNEVDTAVKIYKELAKPKDKKEAFGVSHYPNVIANLVVILNSAGRFDEAIEYANEGIEFCISTSNTAQLPKIINQKAFAMCNAFGINEQGSDMEKARAKEVKEMFRYGYYDALIMKDNRLSSAMEENSRYWFKENIDGTPLE